MTQLLNHLDVTGKLSVESSARERIDALLDEALNETFPASDSSAIGSGTAVIKRERREQKIIDQGNVTRASTSARQPVLQQHIDRSTL